MPTERDRALQGWRVLRESDARPAGGRVPVRSLSATTASGALRVALTGTGLPRLLMPVTPATAEADLPLPDALALGTVSLVTDRGAGAFLELTCLDARLEPVFADVCGAIALRIAGGDAAGDACRRTLDEFATLFSIGPEDGPDTRTVRGFLGELLYLENLLGHDRRAVALWRGPEGGRHDFAGGDRAVEIKTVARPEAPVTIGSFDQLLAPDGGVLHLRVHELHEVSGGTYSVAGLVEALAARTDDVTGFLERVHALGFTDAPGAAWSTLRFDTGAVREWIVDGRFPRITREALGTAAPGLLDVSYTIRPGDAPACEVDAGGRAAMMQSLLGRL